jgi:hypothetical protein
VIWSNHVSQPAYVNNATYDKNSDYQQDLSKCRGIMFHRDAIGVLTLRDIGLQITPPGGDFNVMYQASLFVARMAIGMSVLRSECAGVIETPVTCKGVVPAAPTCVPGGGFFMAPVA